MIDATHAPHRRCWVESANDHPDFPIQNLPLGIFAPEVGPPRGGMAIGDQIFDLRAAFHMGLLEGLAEDAAHAASRGSLNPLFALGAPARKALRQAVGDLLDAGPVGERGRAHHARLLHRAEDCRLFPPAVIGDYTDFFAGVHHARAVGKLFRPDAPLAPNYQYLPVGYHGRSSSIVLSGASIRRPIGQRKSSGGAEPEVGPSRNLDYELELGIWVGPGNDQGAPVPIGEAASHIAGYCLLNDWSARDIQAWESQPLGPFLAKNFASTISPWVVTPEALAPFRVAQAARAEGEPAPLPYLFDEADQAGGALDLELDAFLDTPGLRAAKMEPFPLARSSARHLYWTPAQLLAHHTLGGCNLRPGDLLGTGTISAPTADGCGSLLERCEGGRTPITLPSGETRRFLEDGDEVLIYARAKRAGFASIGFGVCRGAILPAL